MSVSDARAPTMLPARILWPHVDRDQRKRWIIAALALMTRDELASLDADRTFEGHAEFYTSIHFRHWVALPSALRGRVLQYLFGEDSRLAARR